MVLMRHGSRTGKHVCCRDRHTPNKKPRSNLAAEAAPSRGAVLARIVALATELGPTAANRELIRRFEAKIKTTIDRVWSAA